MKDPGDPDPPRCEFLLVSIFAFFALTLVIMDTKTEVDFGKSVFKGKDDLTTHCKRWFTQFVALLFKNFVILKRRPLQLILFLLLPSCVIFTFLLQLNATESSTSTTPLNPEIPIAYLGACESYYKDCVQVVYGPSSPLIDNVMTEFCNINNLELHKDVIGFRSTMEAETYVASNIGRVQFTVLFRNSSLWETSHYSPNNKALPKNMSYVIFFNSSSNNDARSKKYDVNFPMLVLQKTLDEAYMKVNYPNSYSAYELDFGVVWQVPFKSKTEIVVTNNDTTPCDWELRDNTVQPLGFILPWVVTFVYLLLANISFQMIAEERRKKLYMSLRRLGLIDSAYWASWFVMFQVLLIFACIIALISAAFVVPYSSALGKFFVDEAGCK